MLALLPGLLPINFGDSGAAGNWYLTIGLYLGSLAFVGFFVAFVYEYVTQTNPDSETGGLLLAGFVVGFFGGLSWALILAFLTGWAFLEILRWTYRLPGRSDRLAAERRQEQKERALEQAAYIRELEDELVRDGLLTEMPQLVAERPVDVVAARWAARQAAKGPSLRDTDEDY